jgi:hypothetical protein
MAILWSQSRVLNAAGNSADLERLAVSFITGMRRVYGVELRYDSDSVSWLDGYLERLRQLKDWDPEEAAGLAGTLGSFLGECMIAGYGGSWTQHQGMWAVEFASDVLAFPHAKVLKHLENGSNDSVASFYRAIPALIARRRDSES